MADFERKVLELLRDNGCTFVRHGKGDHDIWHSPLTDKNFPVDSKIKARPVANKILKEAGISQKV